MISNGRFQALKQLIFLGNLVPEGVLPYLGLWTGSLFGASSFGTECLFCNFELPELAQGAFLRL